MSDAAKPIDPTANAPITAPGELVTTTSTVPAQDAAPKVDPKVSSRFAALSRKERGLFQKQSEIAAKEAAIAAREKALEEFESEWKADPTKAAEKRGLTYAEWTNRVLNDGRPSAESQVSKVQEDIAALRKEREDEKLAAIKAAQDAETAKAERVVQEFKDSVVGFVKQKPEEYELTNLHQAHNLVIATIEEHFAKTNKILDTKEAADLVELFLEDQIIKATATNRIKAKVKPQPEGDTKQSKQGAGAQPSKTLTNNMTASAAASTPANSESERIKRALAALDRNK